MATYWREPGMVNEELQQDNKLQRIGPAKGGHWQVN
jgi:hypothetical protein